MKNIMVHAVSDVNASNLLLSGFLAHPSMAIINPDERPYGTRSTTEIEAMIQNFGSILLIGNPKKLLEHQVDIYPFDSASATLPDLNLNYIDEENYVRQVHDWFTQHYTHDEERELIDFFFQNQKNDYFDNLYFLLENYGYFVNNTFDTQINKISDKVFNSTNIKKHPNEYYQEMLLNEADDDLRKMKLLALSADSYYFANYVSDFFDLPTSKQEFKHYLYTSRQFSKHLCDNGIQALMSSEDDTIITKESVCDFFDDTQMAEWDLPDDVNNYSEYHIFAALAKKIDNTNIENELYRLNKHQIHEFQEKNPIVSPYSDTSFAFIDDLFSHANRVIDFDTIEEVVSDRIRDIYDIDIRGYFIPALLSAAGYEVAFEYNSFEEIANIYREKFLGDNYDDGEYEYETLYSIEEYLYDLFHYLGQKINHHMMSDMLEMKFKEPVDLNADNFTHVLIPDNALGISKHGLRFIKEQFEQLGIKTVMYSPKKIIDEQYNSANDVLNSIEKELKLLDSNINEKKIELIPYAASHYMNLNPKKTFFQIESHQQSLGLK